jgi:hypothetical protein
VACATLTAPSASAWRAAPRRADAPATSARREAPAAAKAAPAARAERRAAPSSEALAAGALSTYAGVLSPYAGALFPALLPQTAPGPENVQTYAADCATPKSVFNLGETVCARYTGAPTYNFPLRRVAWVNTVGLVFSPDVPAQADVTNANDSVLFTIPMNAVSDEGFDRRGGWSVNLISTSDGSVRAAAAFTVRDPNNAAANLSVFQLAEGGSAVVGAGGAINYFVSVVNRGPDAAQNVTLNIGAPTLSTASASAPAFILAAQLSGPVFDCTGAGGNTPCAIETLPAGGVAVFAVAYSVPSGTADYTVVTSTSSVSSATTDPRPSDNASTAYATVIGATSSSDECALACPEDVTVTADTTQDPDGPGGADPVPGALVSFAAAEPSGECGAVTSSPASGSFFPVGTTLVSSTSANGGACSFTVTVIGAGGPTISCPASYSTVADGCETTIAASDLGQPAATGEGVEVSAERNDGKALDEPFPAGATTVTWTATDVAGRRVSCTQTVNVGVNDTTAPTITAPADVTLSTGESGGACGLVVSEASFGAAEAADGGCAVSVSRTGVPAGNFFPVGSTTITWRATDAAGNVATDTQTITIVEDTPPTVNAPAPTTVTLGASCQAAVPDVITLVEGAPEQSTAYDNCTPLSSLVVTQTPAAGTPVGPGVHTVTITATDAAGNSRTGATTFTVVDETAPTISAPPAVAAGTDAASCSASNVALGAPQTADNCSVTVTNNAPAVFPVGTTTVTWTATDAAGNAATATQAVTVTDQTGPAITPAGADPLVVECHTSFADPGASASDACDGARPVSSSHNVNVDAPGSYAVTYTSSDSKGNTTTRTRAVNVVDTTAPTVTVLGANPVTVVQGDPYADAGAAAADSCAGALPVTTAGAVNTAAVGTYTLTYAATDPSGNTATATRTVVVIYRFTGFFSPVANLPTFNSVKAGQTIPIKFSLNGNRGLGVMAAGFPASQPINCDSNAPLSDLEGTDAAGGNTLTYDAASDKYQYNWKTEKSWANTCRLLNVKLNDGTQHTALFKFK